MLVMFANELEYIWKRPLTGPTVLLIINRYAMLLFLVSMTSITFLNWTNTAEEIAADLVSKFYSAE